MIISVTISLYYYFDSSALSVDAVFLFITDKQRGREGWHFKAICLQCHLVTGTIKRQVNPIESSSNNNKNIPRTIINRNTKSHHNGNDC